MSNDYVARFRCTQETKDALDILAEKQGMKFSELIRNVMNAYSDSYTEGSPDYLSFRTDQEQGASRCIDDLVQKNTDLEAEIESLVNQLKSSKETSQYYMQVAEDNRKGLVSLYRLVEPKGDLDEVGQVTASLERNIKSLKAYYVDKEALIKDINDALPVGLGKEIRPKDIAGTIRGVAKHWKNFVGELSMKIGLLPKDTVPTRETVMNDLHTLKEHHDRHAQDVESLSARLSRLTYVKEGIGEEYRILRAKEIAMGKRPLWRRIVNPNPQFFAPSQSDMELSRINFANIEKVLCQKWRETLEANADAEAKE